MSKKKKHGFVNLCLSKTVERETHDFFSRLFSSQEWRVTTSRQIDTHPHTHTRTHAHTHIHTHTQTRTHTAVGGYTVFMVETVFFFLRNVQLESNAVWTLLVPVRTAVADADRRQSLNLRQQVSPGRKEWLTGRRTTPNKPVFFASSSQSLAAVNESEKKLPRPMQTVCRYRRVVDYELLSHRQWKSAASNRFLPQFQTSKFLAAICALKKERQLRRNGLNHSMEKYVDWWWWWWWWWWSWVRRSMLYDSVITGVFFYGASIRRCNFSGTPMDKTVFTHSAFKINAIIIIRTGGGGESACLTLSCHLNCTVQ